MNISRSKMLETLIERESYWLKEHIERWRRENRKYAIFAAGPTGRDFYNTLKNEYKTEADFFIDNNLAFAGTEACGKRIMFEPWKSNPNFSKEYAVIICSSFEYNNQIQSQLRDNGITEFMTHWQYHDSLVFEQYRSLAATFDDELSKVSYYASIYNRCTGEKKFIQFDPHQYFAHIEFSCIARKIIVDCGAFTGDTTEQFLCNGIFSNKVYAFEPKEDFCRDIEKMWNRLKKENCQPNDLLTIVQSGVGRKTGYASFTSSINAMVRVTNELKNEDNKTLHQEDVIKIVALDDYFSDKQPFDYLKADIEGAEMDMLAGAANIIRKYHPKMMISIYHKTDDFIKIPLYIRKLIPEYKFAVRNHWNDYTDTVLYCWV